MGPLLKDDVNPKPVHNSEAAGGASPLRKTNMNRSSLQISPHHALDLSPRHPHHMLGQTYLPICLGWGAPSRGFYSCLGWGGMELCQGSVHGSQLCLLGSLQPIHTEAGEKNQTKHKLPGKCVTVCSLGFSPRTVDAVSYDS